MAKRHDKILAFAAKMMGVNDNKRIVKQTAPDGVDVYDNIRYLEGDNPMHLLDVYKPQGVEGTLPVIVDIHGGGWIYGTKDINKYFGMSLAKEGFVVVSMSYRLITETHFNNMLGDVFAAFKWVKDNVASYGGDLNNVFLAGDSAGGHLALMSLSVSVGEELQKKFNVTPSLDFKAAGLICPATNIAPFTKMKLPLVKHLVSLFLGENDREGYLEYLTPKNNAIEKFPPMFVNTCYADFIRSHAYDFVDACKGKGIEPYFIDYKKENSTHKLEHVYNILYPEWEESIDTNKQMLEFFRKYITD